MNWKNALLAAILCTIVIGVVFIDVVFLTSNHEPSAAEIMLFGKITATTDTTTSATWPTKSLTELYARFDLELRQLRANNGTTISKDTRDNCLSWLDKMMTEYERAIQQHKRMTWWSEEVCAEAAREFWPRATKLEKFGVPMWRPDSKFLLLYRRYGDLMNQSYGVAYRVTAGSE